MVNLIFVDQEFNKIVDRMGMAIVNTCAMKEHVTDAERNVRTTKDSTRCSVAEFWRIRIRTLPKQVIMYTHGVPGSFLDERAACCERNQHGTLPV